MLKDIKEINSLQKAIEIDKLKATREGQQLKVEEAQARTQQKQDDPARNLLSSSSFSANTRLEWQFDRIRRINEKNEPTQFTTDLFV